MDFLIRDCILCPITNVLQKRRKKKKRFFLGLLILLLLSTLEINHCSRRSVGDKPMFCKPGVAGSIPGFSKSVG